MFSHIYTFWNGAGKHSAYGFNGGSYYWSSTQVDAVGAWCYLFSDGFHYNDSKLNWNPFRAIRSF